MVLGRSRMRHVLALNLVPRRHSELCSCLPTCESETGLSPQQKLLERPCDDVTEQLFVLFDFPAQTVIHSSLLDGHN
jgi:hypothetical protein